MKKRLSKSIIAIVVSFGALPAFGQVNLTPAHLFPPGDTAWTLDTLGISGTVAFKLIVEHTDAGFANSFHFDSPANGFPGGVGTATDDIVVFTGSDIAGKISTLSVPPGANLALFHDITDVSGVFGSGPNGVLNTEDAYLNSDPTRNYTRVGPDQLIKYYGANPDLSYQFTAFGHTVQLGSGFVAFIFIEEDHTPNYDYNDMIIGILPVCDKDADCDDGLVCNGVEYCDFGAVARTGGVCRGGTPPVCDDGVACTQDLCREEPGGYSCLHKPHDQDCDDGNFCNGAEVCDPLIGCVKGKMVDCSDGVDCTVDTCTEKGCVNTPTDAICSDGSFCNGVEFCHRKKGCMAGPPPVCESQSDCTIASCNEDTDACEFVDDGSCDDGLFCNGVEVCDPDHGCLPGTPPDCDDGLACTIDQCNEELNACEHIPDDSLCSNSQFCDGVETCSPTLGCIPGTPPNCGDGVFCTVDSCDEASDQCVHQPDSSLCDDANFCNGLEVCDPILDCQAGSPPVCDDGIACTTNSCNAQLGACEYIPDDSLCSNGLFCDGVETCSPTLGCIPGTPPNCDDQITCTLDSCDEVNDQCAHQPDSSICDDAVFCNGVEVCDPLQGCQSGPPPVCNDSIGCTVDSCDTVSDQCQYLPDDASCQDGVFCNGVEFCDPLLGCQSGPAPDCSDSVPCTLDQCNPQLDACEHIPDDSECANGLYCDGEEICDPLQGCLPGTPIDCDDGVDCTVDSCDEALDQCVNTPTDNLCDDGLFCNGPETCELGDCQPGIPPCAPGLVCDEELGCSECVTDGDCVVSFCGGTPSCIEGECVPDPPSCDDGIPCTVDRCDPKLNACVHTPDDSLCNNGLFCDGMETCDPLQGCLPGTTVNCDDGVACTNDECNELKDLCTHTPKDTSCDDGLFCNGTEICHPTQGCLPGSPPSCVDGSDCTVDTCNEATDQCDHDCSTPEVTCTNQEFECDDVGTFLPPVVNDPCSTNPVATCTEVTTPGKIPQEYTVTRTCGFTNDCGNSASCQQIVEVVDTTPPEVTCPPDMHFECDGIGDSGQPIVSDNCDPDPQVTLEVKEIIGDCTPGNVAGISPPPKLIRVNTYTAIDGGATFAEGTTADGDTTGNSASCTQRIEIVDTRAPLIVACPASVPGCEGQPLEFTPPGCSDTCGTCSVVCTRSDGLPMDDPVPAEPLSIQCVSLDECENASAPCDVSVSTEDCDTNIPTVSQWGLVVLALMLLIAAKLRFARLQVCPA